MLSLGLVYINHDSAAALVGDGKIIAACLEERFNREKHSSKFPHGAIKYCLDVAGVNFSEIDQIGFFTNPSLYYQLALHNLREDFPRSLSYLPYPFQVMRREFGLEKILSKNMGKIKQPISWVTHHLAHAASAYYVSPFDRAAILTLDGRGEFETGCVYIGEGNSIKKIYSLKYPHSLGYLYSMITKFCGFKPFYDEYKLMGLSAYGTPSLCEKFSDVAFFDVHGNFKLNLKYFDHSYTYGNNRKSFSDEFIRKFGPPRDSQSPVSQVYADLAFALQRFTENAMVEFAKLAKKLTNARKLCLAGGVALNCLGISKIIESNLFDDVFVQPASDDSGTSLGSALYCYYANQVSANRFVQDNVFLGPEFSEEEIRLAIKENEYKLDISCCDDPCLTAATLIHEQKVIGWFQGRMEFGPRALGNRSILASPINSSMKDLINSKIKYREEFRPFAPAVLAESVNNFFDVYPAGNLTYPFMLSTASAKHQSSDKIPAVVHADGTSRIQTVHHKTNPLFWRLIKEYQNLSGLPVVLNTSFNVRGEPIVCTPKDAIQSLLNSDLDFAVLGKFLVKRQTGNLY